MTDANVVYKAISLPTKDLVDAQSIYLDGLTLFGKDPRLRGAWSDCALDDLARGLATYVQAGAEHELYSADRVLPQETLEEIIINRGRCLQIGRNAINLTRQHHSFARISAGWDVRTLHFALIPPEKRYTIPAQLWRIVPLYNCNTRLNGRGLVPGEHYGLMHHDMITIETTTDTFGERLALYFCFKNRESLRGRTYVLGVSNPEGDDAVRTEKAKELITELRKRGFEQARLLCDDVSAQQLEVVLARYAQSCHPESHFVFFYTGHGSEKEGLALKDSSLSSDKLHSFIGQIGARRTVIIDACESYVFGIEKPPRNTTIISSTKDATASFRCSLIQSLLDCMRDNPESFLVDDRFTKALKSSIWFRIEKQEPRVVTIGQPTVFGTDVVR